MLKDINVCSSDDTEANRVKPLILSFCSKKLPQLGISAGRKKLIYRKKAFLKLLLQSLGF